MIGFAEKVAVKKVSTPIDVLDWGAVPAIPVPDLVSIQPAGQAEAGIAEHRHQVTTAWLLRTQPGRDIDLAQRDRVVWRTEEFDCVAVDRWPHPVEAGRVHHAEVRIHKVGIAAVVVPGPYDRVILEDREFEVIGAAEDSTRSPYGPTDMYPTPFMVGLRRHVEPVDDDGNPITDDYGNPVEQWSDPIPLPVCGWRPPATDEPKLAGHDRVIVEVELVIPGYVVNLRRAAG